MRGHTYRLVMSDISKQFPGVKALDGVSFKLRPGTVHALLGENGAGKSTLMKCLFGIYQPDGGVIELDGQRISLSSPSEALRLGISMVHQELDQVPDRDVLDNMWLGRYPTNGIWLDRKKMYEKTKALFEEFGIELNLKKKLKDLPVSARQLVDIVKAVSYQSKVIVLDEPTSSLTEREVERLFGIIEKLKAQGAGIIYISHKLDEIKRIADDLTVMRDGCTVITAEAKSLSVQEIIRHMVGRDMTQQFPPKTHTPSDTVILEARGLRGECDNNVIQADFQLHAGEILGVAGLLGSGRTELLETLFGMRRAVAGELLYKGRPVTNRNTMQAIRRGIAFVTEERRFNGIFPDLSVRFNTSLVNIRAYRGRFSLLSNKKMSVDTGKIIDSLRVKAPSQTTKMQTLSGGNQQKVIFGRWLLCGPDIMLLDDPTRGVDVGAKYEIYQLILDLAKQGKSIIVVSSEMPELLGIADRILVMSNGRVSATFQRNHGLSDRELQEQIMTAASKYL